MPTSILQHDPELKARVLRWIKAEALSDAAIEIRASNISVDLSASVASVRQILAELTAEKVLIPELLMVCADCGVRGDVTPTDHTVSAYCENTGDEREFDPIIVFHVAPTSLELIGGRDDSQSPKQPGRRSLKVSSRPKQTKGNVFHRAAMVSQIIRQSTLLKAAAWLGRCSEHSETLANRQQIAATPTGKS